MHILAHKLYLNTHIIYQNVLRHMHMYPYICICMRAREREVQRAAGFRVGLFLCQEKRYVQIFRYAYLFIHISRSRAAFLVGLFFFSSHTPHAVRNAT
jgi:hypothetical protein